MGSYAIYTRRIKSLNQGTQLDIEVKTPCLDIELQDAESRLSRLMAQLYEIIDRLNMEDVVPDCTRFLQPV
ncbi:hypothetical protein V7S43_017175 [Phytophthora oleae]|uniref:COMM domain-containing protein n=1 Tax=Phytophthora oleae TaxID=2107226 RepID=A0ABD3ETG0_9STRA